MEAVSNQSESATLFYFSTPETLVIESIFLKFSAKSKGSSGFHALKGDLPFENLFIGTEYLDFMTCAPLGLSVLF